MRLCYDDEGGGPAVVLLHGFPLGRWIWDAPRAALRDRYRVITPDLRGHGDSEVTPGPYTMDALADDVARLLDALQIERVVLGGLSMGGYVVLAFWRRFAARVRALVLCDTRAKGDDRGEKVMRQSTAQVALEQGTAAVVDGMLPKLLAPRTLAEQPDLCAAVRARLARTDPRAVAASLLGMKERDDSTPTLATITVPTLVLVGSDDQLTPPALARELQAGVPGARLEVVADAGHLAPVEQPAATSAALRDFLDRLP
ncbi:MAG: alpha/beta fold hydrolase [Deltaproteobacteria bacterium]|nr:alpha/beta fold hydrolase [Deltaproteobacteria bacterium]